MKKYLLLLMVIAPTVAFAAGQAPNLRGEKSPRPDPQQTNTNVGSAVSPRPTASRSAVNNRGKATVSRSAVSSRTADNVKPRVATTTPVVNAANAGGRTTTRRGGGVAQQRQTAARSAVNTARATAVFNDVSKIGGGYTDCHDSFATCMDQFCANANDAYRRCYCSDRFVNFRDTADNLDKALSMLAEFQNTNLDAVDKTAAEVNAMYTASEGEAMIKRDTSASQKLLDNIDKLLSGKTSTVTPSNKRGSTNSLGVLDLSSLSSANSSDDIWGGSSSSLFGDNNGSGRYTDMADMAGKELYTNAQQQCVEITRNSCPSDAMFNLARSAYSILISQDCNVYEKNINAKKESVKETLRTAEKYLREARLEEYRAHNSADVNACLSKVEAAIKDPMACGTNYEKCLDYTGKYIDVTTGDPIYSPALFEMNDLIVLNGKSTDMLTRNKDFNNFLEKKKAHAASALDSCRDIADTVWTEFKSAALIQIAQAQDNKIQQVKDSCVATIRECYDKQGGTLNELDTTEFSATGAISAIAARGVCYDRVMACAALYGDIDGCKYDDKTKKLTVVSGKKCGLQSLLTYVDAVDSVKVAEGCEVSLRKYAHELCDPVISAGEDDETEQEEVYPMGCKDTPRTELRAAMEERARLFCAQDLMTNDQSNTIGDSSAFNLDIVNRVVKDIFDELDLAFSSGCEYMGGTWLVSGSAYKPEFSELNLSFYKKYYGRTPGSVEDAKTLTKKKNSNNGSDTDSGWCIIDSMVKTRCLEQGSLASYDPDTNECLLSDEWYSSKCRSLGGTYSGSMCEIPGVTSLEDFLKQF